MEPARKRCGTCTRMPAPSPGGHLGAGGAPVGQVLQGGERLADEPVALAALEVGHQRDAAGVVLEGRVVQGRAGVASQMPRECRVLRCRHSGLSVIGHAEVGADARDDTGPAAALVGYPACTGHLRTDAGDDSRAGPVRRPPPLRRRRRRGRASIGLASAWRIAAPGHGRGRRRSRARPGRLVGGGGDARPGERGAPRRGAAPGSGPGVGAAVAGLRGRAGPGRGPAHRLPHLGDAGGGGRRRRPGLDRGALRVPARPRARRAVAHGPSGAPARAEPSPPACAPPSGCRATTRWTTACSWARSSTRRGRRCRRPPRPGRRARALGRRGDRRPPGRGDDARAPRRWSSPRGAGRASSRACPPARCRRCDR